MLFLTASGLHLLGGCNCVFVRSATSDAAADVVIVVVGCGLMYWWVLFLRAQLRINDFYWLPTLLFSIFDGCLFCYFFFRCVRRLGLLFWVFFLLCFFYCPSLWQVIRCLIGKYCDTYAEYSIKLSLVKCVKGSCIIAEPIESQSREFVPNKLVV